jgi:hypothetical protein
MKTSRLNQLFRSRLIIIAVAMLLFSCVLQGQTYRLLKASNDPGGYADQDEVTNVLTSDELNSFKFLSVTANLIGSKDGQEFSLTCIPGICQRAHSTIPDFNAMGSNWINTNPALEMVVLDISDAEDINQITGVTNLLKQSSSVHYLVLQTYPKLYESAVPSMYEARAKELITPAINDQLNALYNKGIRVFLAAIKFK